MIQMETHTQVHTHRSIYQYHWLLSASFHWLSTMQHLTQRYYIPYILTEHHLHTNTLSISRSHTPTHTCIQLLFLHPWHIFTLRLAIALFLPLSLLFSGVRTMALSHHGNSALMWSWPDISIDISVEWHQYLIIQSQNSATSTVYS